MFHSLHTFAPGRRVFDSASGSDGTVLSTSIAHTVHAAAAAEGRPIGGALFQLPHPVKIETTTLRLDTGETVTRSPGELVALPAALPILPEELGHGPE